MARQARPAGQHADADATPPDLAGGRADPAAQPSPDASEERPRASERYLRQAQRIAKLGHWRWSPETGGLTEWSEEYAVIFGLAHDELDPADESECRRIHPEDRDRVVAAYAAANARPVEFELSYRIVRPDGEIRYVHEIGEPEFDETGNFIAQFGTIQDVTKPLPRAGWSNARASFGRRKNRCVWVTGDGRRRRASLPAFQTKLAASSTAGWIPTRLTMRRSMRLSTRTSGDA